MPIFNMNTMESYYQDNAMLGPRLVAHIVTVIGFMGLLLAVIGLYGAVAYAVHHILAKFGEDQTTWSSAVAKSFLSTTASIAFARRCETVRQCELLTVMLWLIEFESWKLYPGLRNCKP